MTLYRNKERSCPTTVTLTNTSRDKLKHKALLTGLSASDLTEAMIRNYSSGIISLQDKTKRTETTSLSLTKTAKKALDELCASSLLSRSEVVEALIQRMDKCIITRTNPL